MVMQPLEELGETVQRILRSYNYSIDVLNYPTEHMRRSIDLLAYHSSGESLFIKIADDVSALPAHEVRELRRISVTLDAKPLLVAEREKGMELDDIVAYERAGVYTVTSEGLRRIISKVGIYVVRRQGRFYMRVDGRKLREARERKGYSLGDVASMLGVSRRSVYLYEKGVSDVSLEKALKLLEVFGDEIFEPYQITSLKQTVADSQAEVKCDSINEEYIARAMKESGAKIVHLKHTAADLAISLHERKAVILVEHSHRDNVGERAEDAAKIARHTGSKLYALLTYKGHGASDELEELGFEIFTKASELVTTLLKESEPSRNV